MFMNRTRHSSERIVMNLREATAATTVDKTGQVACDGLGKKPGKRRLRSVEIGRANMTTLRNSMDLKRGRKTEATDSEPRLAQPRADHPIMGRPMARSRSPEVHPDQGRRPPAGLRLISLLQ